MMRKGNIVLGIALLLGAGLLFGLTLAAYFSKEQLPALQLPLLAVYGAVAAWGAWLLRGRRRHG